jgi:DNA-directed RNA polymerase specialized sigma24 family protein
VNIMRSLVVRETALNMYFMDGHSYQYVAKLLDVPLDTVKSWVAFLPFFIDF